MSTDTTTTSPSPVSKPELGPTPAALCLPMRSCARGWNALRSEPQRDAREITTEQEVSPRRRQTGGIGGGGRGGIERTAIASQVPQNRQCSSNWATAYHVDRRLGLELTAMRKNKTRAKATSSVTENGYYVSYATTGDAHNTGLNVLIRRNPRSH